MYIYHEKPPMEKIRQAHAIPPTAFSFLLGTDLQHKILFVVRALPAHVFQTCCHTCVFFIVLRFCVRAL